MKRAKSKEDLSEPQSLQKSVKVDFLSRESHKSRSSELSCLVYDSQTLGLPVADVFDKHATHAMPFETQLAIHGWATGGYQPLLHAVTGAWIVWVSSGLRTPGCPRLFSSPQLQQQTRQLHLSPSGCQGPGQKQLDGRSTCKRSHHSSWLPRPHHSTGRAWLI